MTRDRVAELDDLPLRDVTEEAEFLAVSEHTLRQWRWLKKGPRWVKVGRYVRYPRRDTQEWLDAGADSPMQAKEEFLTPVVTRRRNRGKSTAAK